ncbi:MAG: penicillin-binding protein 1A [bacterium]
MPGRKERKNKTGQRRLKATGPLLAVLAVAALAVVIVSVGLLSLAAAPEPVVPLASRFYDIDQNLITTVSVENRIELPLAKIPQQMRDAVIAIEDERFYTHHGFDLIGIARSTVRNLTAGRIVQGASTITQQLARNVFLTHEVTFTRKIKEIFLALQLERKYTKEQILEMYLNTIYFGHGAYGVEVAARTFFNAGVSDLSLAETAFLAGLPRGPSYYSPYSHFDRAKERQEVILNQMAALGYISQTEADTAKAAEIAIADKRTQAKTGAYFIDHIVRYITDKYPEGADMVYREGLEIYTTMDLELQAAADKAFAAGLPAGAPDAAGVVQPQGALVAIDPKTGYVKALIGGRDINNTKLNRAVQSFRQPGSAFKPFVYTAAIDSGAFTAATMYRCEPTTFTFDNQIWEPTDYGSEKFHYADLTLRDALRISDNIVSAKLMQAVTPARAVEYARRMGIKSELRPHLSLVLGTSEVSPLEMAAGYCPLANGGYRVEPLFVLQIKNRNGKVLEDNHPRLTKILDERTAYIVTDMLKGVVRPGGTAAGVAGRLSRPAAGKTGSTDNYVDAWFIGYTPDLVMSVYAGHDNPANAIGRGGGSVGAPIFAAAVQEGMADVPANDFPRPAGIIDVNIDPTTGFLAGPFCPETRTEIFLAGTEPREVCPVHTIFDLPGQIFDPDLLNRPGFQAPPEPDGNETETEDEDGESDEDPAAEPPAQGFAPGEPPLAPAANPTEDTARETEPAEPAENGQQGLMD